MCLLVLVAVITSFVCSGITAGIVVFVLGNKDENTSTVSPNYHGIHTTDVSESFSPRVHDISAPITTDIRPTTMPTTPDITNKWTISSAVQSRANAKLECEQKGAHLLEIITQTDQEVLLEYLRTEVNGGTNNVLDGSHQFWIGGEYDFGETTWNWPLAGLAIPSPGAGTMDYYENWRAIQYTPSDADWACMAIAVGHLDFGLWFAYPC